ncbi:alpha/beta fold hydrolase [Chitinophaga sp. GCM10012297]|uniref:Alpha/beta fold hydrolase n=1 Tax=Chitinophaga chungangae TaxID=2821488 RepID=A0ABS3Y9P9_9BACT|nr:alpha/beta fold hydrolase [Chitinophaga chungangae]MBO9151400.1 alpha/beta fold hydrolase [Chitinophaga chungangae]
MKRAAFCLLLISLCCTVFAQQAEIPAFKTREVVFHNIADSVMLSGTLTYQQTFEPAPAILLIGGSGATDRDGTVFGHKFLKTVAEYLSGKGFTVLRYDERGVGRSTGKAQGADIADLTRDAKAALAFLRQDKQVNPKKLGILGHSEGGAIGLRLAAEDPSVKFFISMAGPGVDGVQMILAQTEAIYRNMGMKDSMVRIKVAEQRAMATAIAGEPDTTKLKARIIANAKAQYAANPMLKTAYTEEKFTSMLASVYMMPEYLSIIRFDPKKYFPAVKCPVLVLNGAKDIQILSGVNLGGWRKGVPKATVKEMPGLNHLFQECNTCSVQEYASIKQTISPAVLEEINSWLWQTAGRRK